MMPRLRLGRGGAYFCATRSHPTRYERRTFLISGKVHAAGAVELNLAIYSAWVPVSPGCMGRDIHAPFLF